MKASRIVLAMLATAPLAAMAGVTITPMIGYQTFGNIMKNDMQPQIAAGYRFNNGLAVEGVFNKGIAGLVDSSGNRFTNQNDKADDGTADYKQFRADGLYYIPTNGSRFEPYVAAGVGQIVIEGTPRQGTDKSGKGAYIQPNVGGGVQYALNDFLKVRLDGRYLNWAMGTGPSGSTNSTDDFQAALGLQLALGGAAAPAALVPAIVMGDVPTPAEPVVAAPLDSDADGVVDANDQCANTPSNLVVDATGCPKVVADAIKLELRVFFDTNKSNIKTLFKPEIAKAAAALKSLPNTTATLEGHTDSRGSTQLNDRLSLARANSVKNALVNEYGISAKRLTAKGYGESTPVASNDTAEGRAMNRRVYAVIEGNKTVEVTK